MKPAFLVRPDILLPGFLLALVVRVQAACVSPAGVAGQLQFISPTMNVCDGYAWSSVGVSTLGTTCSAAGQFNKSGTDMQYCDGAHWVSTDGTQTDGTCSVAGKIQYSSAQQWMEWCNGTNWKAMQTAGAANASGFVQTTKSFGSATSNKISTPAFGAATTTGNTIVCRFYWDKPVATSTSVTDSAGNTYTKAASATGSGDLVELWYSANITGGSGVIVTMNLSSSVTANRYYDCLEYSGLSPTNTLDYATAVYTTGTSATIGPFPTTSAKEVIFFSTILANSITIAGSGTSYFTRSTNNGNPTGDQRVNSVGSYSFSASGLGGGDLFVLATFRVK